MSSGDPMVDVSDSDYVRVHLQGRCCLKSVSVANLSVYANSDISLVPASSFRNGVLALSYIKSTNDKDVEIERRYSDRPHG